MEKSKDNIKDYQENPENNNNEYEIPSKEFNDFISIINKTSNSLNKTISYINNYFSFLELKFTNLVQQIDCSNRINSYQKLEVNEQNLEEIKNNFPKDDLFEKENTSKIYYYFEEFDKHLKFINDKKKEYDNIRDLIINEIKNKLKSFKNKKIKVCDKFNHFLNNTEKFKFNINSIINKNITNLDKLKIENDSNELKILQNYLSEIEKKYNIILLELKELNEDISSFIIDIFNKYLDLTLKKNEEIIKEQNKLINIYKKNNTIKENFFFDETQKMNEMVLKDLKSYNQKKKSKSLLSHIEETIIKDPEYILLMENFGNKNEEEEEENNNYNKEELIILKKILNKLKKSEVVSDLNNAFTILGNNSDRQQYINLCLHFSNYSNSNSLSKKENNYNHFKYYNFDNFIFANNLFKIISHNITKKDKALKKDFKENFKYYKILDNIINIGEKSFIENKYMCTLLKNNKFVEDINNCFKCELISSIKKQFIEKDKINYKQNVIYLIQNKLNSSSYANTDFIKNINIDFYIENYKNLTTNEKNNFNNYELPKIVHYSMKKYLFHMAIYSISYNNTLDFINKICNDFPFIKDEYWNFYLNYYKSSLNSIKCHKFQSKLTDIKIKKKIKYIKQKILNKENQGFLSDEKEINEQKKLILILKNASAFLNYEDKRKLLCLNKKIKLCKYIYRKILEEKKIFLDITKHLNIWKIILGCSKMKKIDYKYFCKGNEEVENYNIIVEDIKRTTIKNYKNKEKEKNSRNCLINILSSFCRINSSKIQYCQGMNFLVAFLYDLTNNKEEDTFSLFSNLMFNTELSKIFDIKFETLKCYFYILNRLIFLFLPQISQKFEEIKLSSDCFACPFFITLFSNTYIISNSSKQFMMFIIDSFIFKGWRIIFSSILSLLKYNEKNILEKEDDEFFNFVVNDLIKSDIFQKENFDKFIELYKNFYIKRELIDNLKEEFYLENKIKKDLNIFVDI